MHFCVPLLYAIFTFPGVSVWTFIISSIIKFFLVSLYVQTIIFAYIYTLSSFIAVISYYVALYFLLFCIFIFTIPYTLVPSCFCCPSPVLFCMLYSLFLVLFFLFHILFFLHAFCVRLAVFLLSFCIPSCPVFLQTSLFPSYSVFFLTCSYFLSKNFCDHSDFTLQRKSHLCIPRKGIARLRSQFPHSCVCKQFLYSQDLSTYFPAVE